MVEVSLLSILLVYIYNDAIVAAVATVDAGGLVTAVAEGVATITASAGEASGSAVVPVMQPVALVEVSPSAETIELGSTLQLTAEGFDEKGDAVEGAEFSWESSDAAVATVDASGRTRQPRQLDVALP